MKIGNFTIIVCLLLLTAGCFTSSKINYFTIDITPPTVRQTTDENLCIEVASVKLSEPLKRKEIMFRKSPIEIGYYSEYLWASTLEEMLTLKFNQYFLCPEDRSTPDYYLHINLLNFEQEFLEGVSQAKVSMKIEVLDPKDMKVLFQKFYMRTEPINSKSIVDTVTGISLATNKIINDIEEDIRNYRRGIQ